MTFVPPHFRESFLFAVIKHGFLQVLDILISYCFSALRMDIRFCFFQVYPQLLAPS